MRRTVVAGLLLALVVLAVWGASPVLATQGGQQQNNERLENTLRREQNLLEDQENRYELANRVMTKAEEWIRHLQGEGKDTSELEAALVQYRAAVMAAGQHLDDAGAAIQKQAGFDGKGKATDQGQASGTVVEAGKAQRQFHDTITPATTQFRAAVMACLDADE